MNVKSLLCAAAMLSVCGIAQAFPDYSILPEPGGSLTSNQGLSTFNLNFTGVNVIVADDAAATLVNEDMDYVYSTAFFEFAAQPGTLIINFDENEIKMNGEWTFTIPAGSITVNGEENPKITATYTLSDPTLGLGDFPQITLESITPAADSKLHMWGGESFSRVDLKTSDDAAVNYINWALFDVTDNDPDDYIPENSSILPIRSGEDNRIDPNRYGGSTDDIWADGLYITLSSLGEKLIEGHKYRLQLRFCGIGCKIVEGLPEYASPDQKNLSTELKTWVNYYGLTEAPEYSQYTYETVMPNPDEYVITSPEFAEFMIRYTGPVKPVAFRYSLGQGAGAATAGEWIPADGVEVNSDGCADTWKFTFFESVVNSETGTIAVTVQTQDADGLYVKGNGDFLFDNYDYSMQWVCNCGAPALISVNPTNDSEVKELSSITISNEKREVMALAYNAMSKPQITDRGRKVIRELDEPVFSDDETEATWTFEPITEPGVYALIIPMYYFNMGTEMLGTTSNETTFRYEVVSGGTGNVTYDLIPIVSPENNSTVEEIGTVTLTFSEETYPVETLDGYVQNLEKAELYMLNGSDYELIASVIPFDNPASDYFAPTIYDFTFVDENGDPFSAKGQYKVVIPAGTFSDAIYPETQSGSLNPEIELFYAVGGTVGVEAIVNGDKVINVYDLNGVQLLDNANVEAAKELKSGIYIINGKKVVIRR